MFELTPVVLHRGREAAIVLLRYEGTKIIHSAYENTTHIRW
jgi:hypothetical protein